MNMFDRAYAVWKEKDILLKDIDVGFTCISFLDRILY